MSEFLLSTGLHLRFDVWVSTAVLSVKAEFRIKLPTNQYINPNNIQLCFQIKIKKKTNNAICINPDMITVNNFFV